MPATMFLFDENESFLRDIEEGNMPLSDLLDVYVRAGSMLELNLSSSMRKDAMCSKTIQDLGPVQAEIRELQRLNSFQNALYS